MILYIVLTSFVIYAISIGFISIKTKNNTYNDLIKLVDSYALEYANITKNNFVAYSNATKSFAQIFKDYENIPENQRRKIFIAQMKNILEKNDDFLSIWSIWEPYSIDTHDSLYVNSQASTFIGNFTPTFYRNKKEILLRYNITDTTESLLFSNKKYAIPKTTRTETILNPDYYSWDTKKISLKTSIVAPIINNNSFLGVIGIDFQLISVQNILNNLNPLKNSQVLLISNNGHFVNNQNKKLINEHFDKLFPDTINNIIISEKIPKGKTFSFFYKNPYTGQAEYYSFAPVFICNTESPWYISVIVPEKVLLKKANTHLIISLIIGIAGLILLIVIIWFIAQTISKPLIKNINLLNKLAKGNLKDVEKIPEKSKDEIGEITRSVNTLLEGLRSTSEFAKQIGSGNLNAEFQLLSKNDALGISLLEMKKNLQHTEEERIKNKEKDDKQNETTQEITKFGDILRKNNNDIEKLSYDILENLLKYLDATLGTLFIINDTDLENIKYELKAAIAFNRGKLIEKDFLIGEGLVGRCANEKITIYITDVPVEFVNFTSGLKDETPRNLLLVPLKLNDEVFGVIELISFNFFENYQIEFIEKVGENIASTLSSVKINQQTTKLLGQAQEQGEQLSSQEEEMRQNIEEMQATQEEAAKRESKTKSTLDSINSISYVAEYDINGDLININDNYLNLLSVAREQIIGKNYKNVDFFIKDKTENATKFWNELKNGIKKQKVDVIKSRTKQILLASSYTPVVNQDGDIQKILNIAIKITE